MTDKRFWAFLLALFALCVFMAAAHAGVRLEAFGGKCHHHLAPDASWHYGVGGYDTDMNLSPECGQLGVMWKKETFGLRAAYVNLGVIRANNSYPLTETAYFRAKALGMAVASETGRFQGTGVSRGLIFGPVAESKHLGAEVGVAALYNTWHVDFPPQGWKYADGWNATYYLGANVRYGRLMLAVRRYGNVHASQADKNPLYIGPTAGPVTQVLFGLSVPLEFVKWAN